MSDIVRNPEDVFYGDFYDMAPLHSHKSHYIENDSNKPTAFVLFFFLNKTWRTNGHVSACLICEPKNQKPKYINCVDLDAACQVLIREKFRL